MVTIIEHPVITHKLAIMRNKETSMSRFRFLLRQITQLMVFELSRKFDTEDVEVETPICAMNCKMLKDKPIVVVPILRAGLGMVDGFLDIFENAAVGHLGMYRDEKTKQPVEYFCKLPSYTPNAVVVVVDPMLATGGSASDAISSLKAKGCKDIRMMNLLACPEGIERIEKEHPDVPFCVAACDEGLNEDAYIVPGLGDAGDRIFGTF